VAAAFVPQTRSLKRLREAAAHCHGCDLYKHATQTVFGEGRARAKLMFVGEEPGDKEDLEGRPFVGPAGSLLRKAMSKAGIDAKAVYLTNVVKHFKFIVRGKRRIHVKPKVIEIQACEPWLIAEIQQVRPELVVALGATAAQALMGTTSFRLTQHRGRVLASAIAGPIIATVHPASILRAQDSDARKREMASFVHDLKIAAAFAL
jgi:uracil-DNA glycosylase